MGDLLRLLTQGVLSNISSITDLGGLDPVWLFMVVGGVMFILGFAGCIGALRENTFLLKFVRCRMIPGLLCCHLRGSSLLSALLLQFSVFLGIIFFLELTTGVLAFVFKDWIKDQLNLFINNNIRAYRDDIDLQNLIDFTQEYVSGKQEAQMFPSLLRVLKASVIPIHLWMSQTSLG